MPVDTFVTPLILCDRPGANGTPTGGACQFTSRSAPSEGPYVYSEAGNVFVSEYAARVLSNKFGLLISPEAESRFVAVSEQNRTLTARVDSIADENRVLESKCKQLEVDLEAERRRADSAVTELAERASAADHFATLFGPKPKAPAKELAGVR
jgi:outer membrane murein-binding lipoprotein Lpp